MFPISSSNKMICVAAQALEAKGDPRDAGVQAPDAYPLPCALTLRPEGDALRLTCSLKCTAPRVFL